MLGIVVVIYQFIYDINPIICPLTIEVLVESFHDCCLFIRVCGEVLDAMLFQQIFDTDIVKLLAVIKL